MLAPLLTRWLGTRVFYLLALVPVVGLVESVRRAPAVLDGVTVRESFDWIPQISLAFGLRLDVLSWVMSLIVLGVGALVLVYCARYFSSSEPALGRFAGIFVAFAGAM